MTIGLAVLFLISLFCRTGKPWKDLVREIQAWWGVGMIPFLYAFGLIHSDHFGEGRDLLVVMAPLFMIPFCIALWQPVSRASVLLVMKAYLLACYGTSLFALGAVIWGAWEMGDWSFARFSYERLASQVLMHPTFLGLMLNVAMLVQLWMKRESLPTSPRWLNWIHLPGILYLFGFMVLLSARMQLILFLVILLVAGLWWMYERKQLWQGVVLSALLLIFAMGIVLISEPNRDRFANLLEASSQELSIEKLPENGVAVRRYLWKSSWGAIRQQVLLGYGSGDRQAALQTQFLKDGFPRPEMNSHNQFLDTGLALGLVGMLALVGAFGWLLWESWQTRNYLLAYILLLILLSCLTESILQRQWGVFLLGFWVGILTNTNHIAEDSERESRP